MAYDMNQNEIIEAAARITPQWLAGFFDGEGNISVWKNPRVYTFHVTIGQAEPKVLALIQYMFGGGVSSRVTKGRVFYSLRWCGKSALPILEAIKDHVVCKKRQVEAACEMVKLHELEGGRTRVSEKDETRRAELAHAIVEANHGIDTRVAATEQQEGGVS